MEFAINERLDGTHLLNVRNLKRQLESQNMFNRKVLIGLVVI